MDEPYSVGNRETNRWPAALSYEGMQDSCGNFMKMPAIPVGMAAAAGEWVQLWGVAEGSRVLIRGGPTDDGMLLEGRIPYVGNGTTAAFRGLRIPLPDARVRQFFEQSDDTGETREPWFEGFYRRVEQIPTSSGSHGRHPGSALW